MKDRRIIIRPPMEANSLLLLVTAGCSHNKCWFCGVYKDQVFETEHIDQIEQDLIQAKKIYGSVKRVFLVNGEAFVLSAARLKIICEKIMEYFPEVESINMYAAIRNIKGKTDKELKMLRDLRIKELYIGIETAHIELLNKINKGHDYNDALVQLQRLNKARIGINAGVILGLGGKNRGLEVAKANADFFNIINPKMIATMTLSSYPGTQMTEDIKNGLFELASEREILQEERELISRLELKGTEFWGMHILQSIPIQGYFPKDKQRMIDTLGYALNNLDEELLNSPIIRKEESRM